MLYLILASLLWSFSFGLIKQTLGGVDPALTAFLRLGMAGLVFLPFLRPRRIAGPVSLRLAAIGGVQYGLMYVFYIASYRHLDAHEVAVLTVLTPILVVLCDDLLGRRFSRLNNLAALLAVVGAAVLVVRPGVSLPRLGGATLVQLANACFAVGQVAYRRVMRPTAAAERRSATAERRSGGLDLAGFGWLYLGATLVAGAAWQVGGGGGIGALTGRQWGALLYLGVLPSGLGFFLWNSGARRVPTGMLAVMNNLKVPLAVLVALTVFREHADIPRLALTCAALALALWAVRGAQAKR
jgi:drug/metabolite transporter (DMT)-like permease